MIGNRQKKTDLNQGDYAKGLDSLKGIKQWKTIYILTHGLWDEMQETYRIQEHQVLAFDSVVQVKMCFPQLNSDI